MSRGLPWVIVVGVFLIAYAITAWFRTGVSADNIAVTLTAIGRSISHTERRRARVGDSVTHQMKVTNLSDRTAICVRVVVDQPFTERTEMYFFQLAPGASDVQAITRRAARRGCTNTAHVEIVSYSPTGAVTSTLSRHIACPITVHPPVAEPLHLRGTPVEATSGESTTRDLVHARGIRDYRQGDGVRSINWRASSRRDRLVVTERETFDDPHDALVLWLVDSPVDLPGEQKLAQICALALAAMRSHRRLVIHVWVAQTALDGSRHVVYSPAPTLNEQALLDWFAALHDVVNPGDQERRLVDPGLIATPVWCRGL